MRYLKVKMSGNDSECWIPISRVSELYEDGFVSVDGWGRRNAKVTAWVLDEGHVLERMPAVTIDKRR